jgi:hypothetical protein
MFGAKNENGIPTSITLADVSIMAQGLVSGVLDLCGHSPRHERELARDLGQDHDRREQSERYGRMGTVLDYASKEREEWLVVSCVVVRQ